MEPRLLGPFHTAVILVDTSVWIDYFRSGEATLARLLGNSTVLAHPWVTGEIALGNLSRRDEVIGLIQGLPQATLAEDDEILRLIDQEVLYGAGIGYVDAQLVVATKLTPTPRYGPGTSAFRQSRRDFGLGFQPTPHPGSRR